MRDELIENKVLTLKDNALTFEKDFLFSSPSSAAAVIMGRSANGLKEWKDQSGRELSAVETVEINE